MILWVELILQLLLILHIGSKQLKSVCFVLFWFIFVKYY